jgi:MFS family permease
MSFTSALPAGPEPRPAERWLDVYLCATARAVSLAGDFLAAIALVLALQSRGAGGWAVAALLLAAAVPPALLGPVTGRLVDRVDSRLLLVSTGLAQAAVCVALAYASGTVVIVALVATLSAGLAVTQPTLAALVPGMVTKEHLAKASALGQTASSLGLLAGPAVGGLLVGRYGLHAPLLIDAATYLAIALAGLVVRTRRGGRRVDAGAPGERKTPTWRVRDDRLLWSMIVLVGAVIALVSAVNVADVFFVREALRSTPTMYGLLTAVWTGSLMIGAWGTARLGLTDSRLVRYLLGAIVATSVLLVPMALVPSVGVLVPFFIVGGALNGAENVAAGVLLARRSPVAARGHAYAIYGAVANGANAIGFLVGGAALGVLPVRGVVLLAGVGGVLIAVPFVPRILKITHGDGTSVSQVSPDRRVASGV